MCSKANSDPRQTKLIQNEMPRIRFVFAGILFTVLALVTGNGCQDSDRQRSSNNPRKHTGRIVVVSYAYQYLTQRITGPKFTIEFPAEQSRSPMNWTPSVDNIISIQNADLIVTDHPKSELATWLTSISLPKTKICYSANLIENANLVGRVDSEIHSHGPGDESGNKFPACSWLDPKLAMDQSSEILSALIKTYPSHEESFRANFLDLKSELESTYERFQTDIPPTDRRIVADRKLIYFLNAVKFNQNQQVQFQSEHEIENTLNSDSNEPNLDFSLVLPASYSEKLSTLDKEQRSKIVTIETLIKKPESGNFDAVLAKNFENLIEPFAGTKPRNGP